MGQDVERAAHEPGPATEMAGKIKIAHAQKWLGFQGSKGEHYTKCRVLLSLDPVQGHRSQAWEAAVTALLPSQPWERTSTFCLQMPRLVQNEHEHSQILLNE